MVEEITCERVKGINKRTGHRGRIKDQEEGRWHKETGREGQGGERRLLEEDRIQAGRVRKRSERRVL